MYIKEEKVNKNVAHGSLRDKLVREIRKKMITKEEMDVEEKLRKKMLEDIRKGELKIPA